MSEPVDRKKHPAKMSFWAESSAMKLNQITDPGTDARAAAARVIAREPDGDRLALMILGSPA